MNRIELEIVSLSHSVSHAQNYAVVLKERYGTRRLPIVIGSCEAHSIAIAIERMMPSRPLTHDLFKSTLETFQIELREVVINNLLDGIFYARLVCVHQGETYEIDSRTSDALALAVRFECPIYTYEFILDAAGIAFVEEEEEDEPASATPPRETPSAPLTGRINLNALENYTEGDLERFLREAIEREDYETAAKIRDELRRRKGS
ncbi:MAG: bifunctional nuclease family protein [Saprospiraceae bacterium]|nr:bifunctional nuclease family protein [Saprospiraceae bacterium]MDW8482924.1 bifunctional nuclease family protein [Saprospiraceae bacterium]